MTTCQTPGCTRAPMASSSGALYALCDACTRRVLAAAFAPEDRRPEWVRRMQAGRGVAKDLTKA